MKVRALRFIAAVVVVLILAGCSQPDGIRVRGDGLLVAGRDEVFVLDMGKSGSAQPERVWSWSASDTSWLPENYLDKFRNISDCKSVNGGTQILITSSDGGIAVVDVMTKKAVFYAFIESARSADLMPYDKIVVVNSDDDNTMSNSINIFDYYSAERSLNTYPIPFGRGVVWDEDRQILWVLSDSEMRAYTTDKWDTFKPGLILKESILLPEKGGRDLFRVPVSGFLSISTKSHCWLFNCDKKEFVRHPDLYDKGGVTSVCVHPSSGRMAYVSADEGVSGSYSLRFLLPEQVVSTGDELCCRARWYVKEQ